MKNELKMHPSYWVLHKKFWQEEYDVLDKDVATEVMRDPRGAEAYGLEKKVRSKIRESLMYPA
tara:strand:+ start:205 stop:393 length:189 start_codon:yes stop_codon:yes gene_type:complete